VSCHDWITGRATDDDGVGKDLIFQGLQDYIAKSKNTNVRGFHFTMTYFWLQMVHLGIRNVPDNLAPASPGPYPTSEDFFRFLLINPHLVDGGLWSVFYSKEVIMTPQAKAEMVLPDRKALPNVVGRDIVREFGGKRIK